MEGIGYWGSLVSSSGQIKAHDDNDASIVNGGHSQLSYKHHDHFKRFQLNCIQFYSGFELLLELLRLLYYVYGVPAPHSTLSTSVNIATCTALPRVNQMPIENVRLASGSIIFIQKPYKRGGKKCD